MINNPNFKPSRNFVAIDVEYADSKQNICQIGLAIVENLEIVESRCYNIQPPGNHYDSQYLQKLHLTPDDTAGAPTFEQVWPEIAECLRDKLLWAHNAASVENRVINKNIARCYSDIKPLQWVNDSRDLYQRTDCPKEKGNGLQQCCMALGIPFDESRHHTAEYDACMCAKIVIAAAENHTPSWEDVPVSKEDIEKQQQFNRVLRLGELATYYKINPHDTESVHVLMSSSYSGAPEQSIGVAKKDKFIPGGNNLPDVDFSRLNVRPDNALHGRIFYLSGVSQYKRESIKNAIKAMGGAEAKSISGADVVILGTRNVGPNKLIELERKIDNGIQIACIVGDEDLEELLYGDGWKFFKK